MTRGTYIPSRSIQNVYNLVNNETRVIFNEL